MPSAVAEQAAAEQVAGKIGRPSGQGGILPGLLRVLVAVLGSGIVIAGAQVSMSARRRPTTSVSGLAINRDLVRYREHYPESGENLNITGRNLNLRFYSNAIKSVPDGDYIDNIHKEWFGKYSTLELHHGYVQWLFPIHEEGMNHMAQILQVHEREAMVKSALVIMRVKKSYELILDFYGAKVICWTTGELVRTPGYKVRFSNLNSKPHNYLRITRILKWLGEMNLEHLKFAFLIFFAHEALFRGTLPNVPQSLRNFWLATLRDDEELRAAVDFVDRRITFEEAMVLVRNPEKRGYDIGSIQAALHSSPMQQQPKQQKGADDDSNDDVPLITKSHQQFSPSTTDKAHTQTQEEAQTQTPTQTQTEDLVGAKRQAESVAGKPFLPSAFQLLWVLTFIVPLYIHF